MSTVMDVPAVDGAAHGFSWALWLRQISAILRLEAKKNFLGRRALLMYLLAAAPVLLLFALTNFDDKAQQDIKFNWGEAKVIFANIYEGLILRTVIFFGCAWIFMNLFRGEIVDRSLHYYLLTPLRREVLLVGKFFSGLVASISLFGLSTLGALFFLYQARGYPQSVENFFGGVGLGENATYLGITAFACLGYGAFFLIIGLFFRNPIIPALVAYGWEWINFLLPPVLKKISVIHYLHSLMPVPVSEGPFALVADPTPAYIAIPGMLLVTILVLTLAAVRIRRLEIRYGGE